MAKVFRVSQRMRAVKLRLCQLLKSSSKEHVQQVLAEGVNADVVVISELSRDTANDLIGHIREQAAEHRQYIVLGRGVGTYAGRTANEVGIYTPDGDPLYQTKLSLSQWDREQRPPLEPGVDLQIHTSGQLRFVVLNCHDYTHASLLHALVETDVDVVIVVAANQASQMYAEYARADAHRLFAYVVVCNVAEIGGSGVYAPFMSRRTESGIEGTAGELTMGGVQFEARGCATTVVDLELAIPELRAMRERYRRIDPDDPKAIRALPSEYRAIAPPESVTYSRPRYREVIGRSRTPGAAFEDVRLPDKRPPARCGNPSWRLAVAQLHSAGMEAYLQTRYVPSRTDAGRRVAQHVAHLLASATADSPRSQLAGAELVVFPEVFLPIHSHVDGKTLDEHLRAYATATGTIVIGGIEYDEAPEQPGANRVRIYAPDRSPLDYVKLTRSQYDARESRDGKIGPPFAMSRGDRLLRVTVGDTLSLGLLTCFDFSHIELIHMLNTVERPPRQVAVSDGTVGTINATGPTPLDLIIVPCFNPFGALYADLARADAHRYYQYIAVCNVADHGESGVFGPEHTSHPRRTLIQAGRNVETILRVDLAIGELRTARDKSSDDEIARARREVRTRTEHARTFHRKPGLLTDGERVLGP